MEVEFVKGADSPRYSGEPWKPLVIILISTTIRQSRYVTNRYITLDKILLYSYLTRFYSPLTDIWEEKLKIVHPLPRTLWRFNLPILSNKVLRSPITGGSQLPQSRPAQKSQFKRLLIHGPPIKGRDDKRLTMSRNNTHRTYIMNNIDTDLEELRLDTPPSPNPIPMDRGHSDEGGSVDDKRHGNSPPETPYYDYACDFIASQINK